MVKLTIEAKDFIKRNLDLSNRALKDSLLLNFGISITHSAIGRYKNKVMDTLDTSMDTSMDTFQEEISEPKIDLLDFNSFMQKLELSNSYTAKHLKALVDVKGKYRSQNKEKVIRIIRDVLDILRED